MLSDIRRYIQASEMTVFHVQSANGYLSTGNLRFCRLWLEDCFVLRCGFMESGRSLPTFRESMMPPSIQFKSARAWMSCKYLQKKKKLLTGNVLRLGKVLSSALWSCRSPSVFRRDILRLYSGSKNKKPTRKRRLLLNGNLLGLLCDPEDGSSTVLWNYGPPDHTVLHSRRYIS
jgi:hypothetical protein